MNPMQWTIYHAGDSKGVVIDAPSLEALRHYQSGGINWVNRGYNVESIRDVILDLEMCAELDEDERQERRYEARHEADDLLDNDGIYGYEFDLELDS